MRNHPRSLAPRDDYVPESFEGKKIGVLSCALVHESGRHVARKTARSIFSLTLPPFLFVLEFTDGSRDESSSEITRSNLHYISRNLHSCIFTFPLLFPSRPVAPSPPPPRRPKMSIKRKKTEGAKEKREKETK